MFWLNYILFKVSTYSKNTLCCAWKNLCCWNLWVFAGFSVLQKMKPWRRWASPTRQSRWGIAEDLMAVCSHLWSNNKQHKSFMNKGMSTLYLSWRESTETAQLCATYPLSHEVPVPHWGLCGMGRPGVANQWHMAPGVKGNNKSNFCIKKKNQNKPNQNKKTNALGI